MAQQSQRERLRQWLGEGDPQLVPIVYWAGPDLAATYFGKTPEEVTAEDDLAAAQAVGVQKFYVVASPQLFQAVKYRDDLIMETEAEERTDTSGVRRQIRTNTLSTPHGVLADCWEAVGDESSTRTQCYVSGEADVAVYAAWVQEAAQTILDNRDQVKADVVKSVQSAIAASGDSGVVMMWLFTPMVELINLYFSQTDGILWIVDQPRLLHELCELQLETTRLWIEAGDEADVDVYGYAINGLEIYSPKIFEEFLVPYTRQINQDIRRTGRLSWYHCCGKMARLVEMGYFDQMEPDIVESFSEPPEGDVTHLRDTRERLSWIRASRGGVNSGHIHSQSPEQLRTRTRHVLESMRGFRHMIGATDDLLHHTPLVNLLAITDAVRESGRLFPWGEQ